MIILLAVVLLIAVSIYVFLRNTVSSVTVYVDPGTINRTVGQDFSVDVKISNVIDLYGWGIKLRWNATVLEVVNATEGSFLRNNGTTFFTYDTNATVGNIVVDCTLLGNRTGVNGSGTLVTIQFHVKESGDCILGLYESTLIDSSEQSITPTTTDAHFTSVS